jgi:hypothetical protein
MAIKKHVLSRDELLKGASSRPREQVELDGGGVVWVQGLTGTERDRYEQTVMERKKDGRLVPNLENARARLVAVSLVNEDGTPMFREDEVALIGSFNARTLQRIWDKACELSGLSESDVEELEGNFDGAQPEGSPSDSQDISGTPSADSSKKYRAVS